MDNDPGSSSSNINPQRIRKSAAYRAALARSAKVLRKPEKLQRLIGEATAKINRVGKGPLADVRDSLYTLFRLLGAYGNGRYRDVSGSSLMLVVAAIGYFVMPLDLLPDILLGLGYIDDAAILTWTINTIAQELDKFRDWEAQQARSHARPVEMAED